MRLEQGTPPNNKNNKPDSAEDFIASADYPSTRYFQVHFQHLYEVIEALKEQITEANRQIATQNEILQALLQQSDLAPISSDRKPLKPRRNGNNPSAFNK